MEAEQETQENGQAEEETCQENIQTEKEVGQKDNAAISEPTEQNKEHVKDKKPMVNNQEDRANFFHGLAVGLGIGCIATFLIVWISVFFAPKLPSGVTYENLLSIFIYPLVYLLAVGLIALTAGLVREYYAKKQALNTEYLKIHCLAIIT
jgi:hypothetical protein